MTGVRPHHPIVSESLLVAITVTLLLLSSAAQWLARPAADGVAADGVAADGAPPRLETKPELEWQARYLLGMDQLLRISGQDPAQARASFDELVSSAPDAVDRLRLSALALALDRPDEGARLVDSTRGELDGELIAPFAAVVSPGSGTPGSEPSRAGPTGAGPPSRAEPPTAPAPLEAQALETAHGFFGELVTAAAEGELAAQRTASLRFCLFLLALAALVFGAVVLGCVLSAAGYLRWRDGRLHSTYRRQTAPPVDSAEAPRTLFLETVLLAILGMQVLGVIVALSMSAAEGAARWPLLLNWLLLPLMLWPLARGLDRRSFLAGIGWTRGRGLIVEMGCGLIGYIAAAPLLVLGFLASALIARGLAQPPHHPILDWVRGAGTLDLVLIVSIATLWAPIVEESLFRGAFFHYLRARWGPLSSAFAVSVAFAALHPQGLAGLPFLICLAVSLAMVREWRGSLIAPITVHMIHNGLVMGLLLSLV